MEVRNLFAGELHQPGLFRAERDKQLQTIVPDARIHLPAVAGAKGDGEEDAEQARVGAPGMAGLPGQSSTVLHYQLQPNEVKAYLGEKSSGCED